MNAKEENRTKFIYFLLPLILGIAAYSLLQIFQAWNDEDKTIASSFENEVKIHKSMLNKSLDIKMTAIANRSTERADFSRTAININRDRRISKDELTELLIKTNRYISKIKEDIGTLKGVSIETYPSHANYITKEINCLEKEEKTWQLFREYLLISNRTPQITYLTNSAWLEFYDSIPNVIQANNAAISSAQSAVAQLEIEIIRTIAEQKMAFVDYNKIKRTLRIYACIFIVSSIISIFLGFLLIRGFRSKPPKRIELA